MISAEHVQFAIKELLHKYPDLSICCADFEKTFYKLADTYRFGGKLLVCGNGGSASDSEHIVGELMKGFMSKRPLQEEQRNTFTSLFPDEGAYLADHLQGALPAISLVSHSALMTAYANDVAHDMIFAQQVFGFAKPGDALLAISTSGNSGNVIRAVQVAKALGVTTIGLTGEGGGRLAELCDVTIRVPWRQTPDIQERHLPLYHTLCVLLEKEFFA